MEKNNKDALNARRYDLDWLRVMAVLLLVPFHSALIFNFNPNRVVWVKNQVESLFLIYAAEVLRQFHMPLLFFIAGASSWYALDLRSSGQYIKARVLRLFIPYIFCVPILIPPMLYVQFLWKPELLNRYASFFEYYPHFFQFTNDLTGYNGTFTPGHLWFIIYLFLFSLFVLPIFLYLKGIKGQKLTSTIAELTDKPGMILLFVIPILISHGLSTLHANPFYYICFFVFGYIIMTDMRFQVTIRRYTMMALAFAVVSAAILVFWLYPLSSKLSGFHWQSILIDFVKSLNTWCWIMALLGLGHKHLSFTNRLLHYANSAAYPFYLLHLPVNTIIAYFVIQWSTGIGMKYLLINVITIVVTILIYDLLVKRTSLTRVLFGMRRITKTHIEHQNKEMFIKS